MTKPLLGVLVFAGLFLLFVFFFIFRFCYGIYKRIKTAKRVVEETLNAHHGRDYTGRRAQQYHYSDRGEQHTSGMNGAAQPRRTQTQSGEVIIDRRQPDRKIFSDDDGEYVDFVEN